MRFPSPASSPAASPTTGTGSVTGAGNRYVTDLVRALVTLGEVITDVPPGLTSQHRSKRGGKTNDDVDAGVIAKAALANPSLPRYTRDERVELLKRLTRTQQRLAKHMQPERAALPSLPPESPMRDALGGVVTSLQDAIGKITAHVRRVVQQLDPPIL